MNPFKINITELKESKKVTDERELIKIDLVAQFLKKSAKMETNEILEKTGLHKADLSRIRAFNLDRFTIDKIVGLLIDIGYSTKIKVM